MAMVPNVATVIPTGLPQKGNRPAQSGAISYAAAR
jgi:hypothetical protein